MKKITENYVRVMKFRLKRMAIPNYEILRKIKGYIPDELFNEFVHRAIDTYKDLLIKPYLSENTNEPKNCVQNSKNDSDKEGNTDDNTVK